MLDSGRLSATSTPRRLAPSLFSDADISTRRTSYEHCLNDPLYLGYLLKFCEGEYNSENVRFIVAVDGFRDMVLAKDKSTWARSWKELDKEYISTELLAVTSPDMFELVVENRSTKDGSKKDAKVGLVRQFSVENVKDSVKESLWTSRLSQTDYDRAIRYIWNEFLADSSTNQICLPASVACKTKIRYKLRHLYGPEIFNESCIEPIKTIRADILPRFITSSLYQAIESYQRSEYDIMKDLSTVVPKPLNPVNKRFSSKASVIDINQEFELFEILDNGILFCEFLDYLSQSLSSENLLCVRMIEVYEDFISHPTTYSQAVEQSWKIYKTFISPGCPHEISLTHLDRKDIMIRMANPNLVLFESAKKSAYHALRGNFEQFRTTKQYRMLGKSLRDKLDSRSLPSPALNRGDKRYQSSFNISPSKRSFACFGTLGK